MASRGRTRRRDVLHRATDGSDLVPPVLDIQLCVDIFRNLHVGLAVWRLEDPSDETSFRLVAINPAIERISQQAANRRVGTVMAETFPNMFKAGMPQVYAEVVRSGRARDLGVIHYGDDIIPAGKYAAKAFPLPNNCVGALYERLSNSSGRVENQGHTEGGRENVQRDFGLTPREREVLYLVAAGRLDKEIATRFGISARTVQKHLSNILRKMQAASRTEASVLALRAGLLY